MAALCGEESRRWTVSELVERLKGLGICASKLSVTAALADLELELELAAWAPWRLVERGNEWILAPKSELLGLLARARKLPLKGSLSEEHKAVLLVVIGHRRRGGVSKTRIGEILKLADPSPLLHDLLAQELVYCDPRGELNFWRATQSALLALGLRSSSDIPALKELEEWFEVLSDAPQARPDSAIERGKKLYSRRRKRELERRQSVAHFSGSGSSPGGESVPGQEGESDCLRGDPMAEAPLPHPAQESPQSVVQSRSG